MERRKTKQPCFASSCPFSLNTFLFLTDIVPDLPGTEFLCCFLLFPMLPIVRLAHFVFLQQDRLPAFTKYLVFNLKKQVEVWKMRSQLLTVLNINYSFSFLNIKYFSFNSQHPPPKNAYSTSEKIVTKRGILYLFIYIYIYIHTANKCFDHMILGTNQVWWKTLCSTKLNGIEMKVVRLYWIYLSTLKICIQNLGICLISTIDLNKPGY